VEETISTYQTGHRKTQKTNKTMHISPKLEMQLAANFQLACTWTSYGTATLIYNAVSLSDYVMLNVRMTGV
jgi:hypothetical protein